MSGEFRGLDFVLQRGNGAAPEVFTTIAGLRTKTLTRNAEMIDATSHGSNQFRELLAGAGVKSFSGSFDFVKKDSAVLTGIETDFDAQTLNNYRFVDGNGDSITSAFKVTQYAETGGHNTEHSGNVTLESSGAITKEADIDPLA